MTKWILAVAVVGLCLIGPACASALPVRPAVVKAAEQLHEAEHLEGGSVAVGTCRHGKQQGTAVCDVVLSGNVQLAGEVLEANCSLTVAGVWHRIVVEGFAVVGGGYWVAHPASLTRCEGSPVE